MLDTTINRRRLTRKATLLSASAALLVLLLLFVAMLTALAALDSDPPTDRLPLRRVPESACTSAGIALYPTYGEEGSFGPKGAEVLAAGLVCCGEPSQTVLVRVGQVGSDHPTLAYALNYDTDKAPEDAPLGGHFLTAFTKDLDYYVAFLDAHTGDLIYHLQPGSYPPFPLEPPYKSASKQIIARNLDGPDAFLTPLSSNAAKRGPYCLRNPRSRASSISRCMTLRVASCSSSGSYLPAHNGGCSLYVTTESL